MQTTPPVDQAAVQRLRELIAVGSRILAKFELVDYLGHVSARVPGSDHVLIRARGAEQGDQLRMRPDQVVLVDPEGEPVAEQAVGGSPPMNQIEGEEAPHASTAEDAAYRPPDE